MKSFERKLIEFLKDYKKQMIEDLRSDDCTGHMESIKSGELGAVVNVLEWIKENSTKLNQKTDWEIHEELDKYDWSGKNE